MTGLIARCDKSGLGIQTLRLARLIKPDRILLIDSTPFNRAPQYPSWYANYETKTIVGFPTDSEVADFLKGVDKVISCETFYNNRFTTIARDLKVETILIANPEFFDWFNAQFAFVPLPNKVVVPSEWLMDEMHKRFNAEYLPTPIFHDEFRDARETNFERTGKPKYLFINGKTAEMDRGGLESVYEALHVAKGDFTITVKAQNDVKKHPDPRLIYDFTNPERPSDLYKDYDALIHPRRYAGQSLPMCEALMCGLPVVMTDIDPNNKVLPREWLVPSFKVADFMTRIPVEVYCAEKIDLAHTLDTLNVGKQAKEKAYKIGMRYDAERLRPKYQELLK